MPHPQGTSLKSQLLSAETGFLDAVVHGADALNSFHLQWASLQQSLTQEVLDPSTAQVAFSVSQTIAILAESLLNLDIEATELSQRLNQETSQILDSNHLIIPAKTNPSPARSPSPSQSQSTSSNSAYIQPSYTWLLSNLHYPYPSRDIKSTISSQTCCPVKDIDAWFVDVRKRIGWNALRKARFLNKRADIVDAATRFFVKGDPKRPLDAAIELEFVAIESRARDLYTEKFLQSFLATKLDGAVKDMTPDMKMQAKSERKQRRRLEQRGREQRARDAYPSPSTSPEPSLPASPPQRNYLHTTEVSQLKRKRRESSASATSDDEAERSVGMFNKRPRFEPSASLQDSGVASLPSPAASLPEASEVSSTPSTPPVTVFSLDTPSAKRKRRSSSADGQRPYKQPHTSHISSPPQFVPHPLATSVAVSSFDEWYKSTFIMENALRCNRPPAVSVEAPDKSSALDIEIYSFPACDVQVPLPSNTLTATLSNSVATQGDGLGFNYDNENMFSWFDLGHCDITNNLPHEAAALHTSPSLAELVLPYHMDFTSSHKSVLLEPSLPPVLHTTSTPCHPSHGNAFRTTPPFEFDLTNVAFSSYEDQGQLLTMQKRLSTSHAELAADS